MFLTGLLQLCLSWMEKRVKQYDVNQMDRRDGMKRADRRPNSARTKRDEKDKKYKDKDS